MQAWRAVQLHPPGPSSEDGRSFPPAGDLPVRDFVDCYRIHYGRLVQALSLAGGDRGLAEEAAQEAFARALALWARVSRGPNPAGYVYVAGFRLLARAARRSRRGEPSSEPRRFGFDALDRSGAEPTESEAVLAVDLRDALARMPARRRACAVMCLVVGLSTHEAGEALGIADGTVRKHLEEARRDLAVLLG